MLNPVFGKNELGMSLQKTKSKDKCSYGNIDVFLHFNASTTQGNRTLKVFSEMGIDWESSRQRKFIGDCCHYEDKPQTLANLTNGDRRKRFLTEEYMRCEVRIRSLRKEIHRNNYSNG